MRPSSLSWTAVLSAIAPAHGLYRANDSLIAPCDSEIYCYGDLLREIQLARPFGDSKTFVDLPTLRPLEEVQSAFRDLPRPLRNDTALNDFLSEYFGQAGEELEDAGLTRTSSPEFLANMQSEPLRDFTDAVIDKWAHLSRRYKGSTNCTGCVDSFLPINRTFVVAGGRFREPYYWDSFWIIEGLLRSGEEYQEISANIILNFLDFVEQFGFVPNGARKYYLNRSQPPLLTQMVRIFIEQTGDDSILERALPLLEKEFDFWYQNRTVSLQRGGRDYSLSHYAVENTEPRPESYREDFNTASNTTYYNLQGRTFNATSTLNETEKARLYANLASGAESGWDYSARWLKAPADAVTDTYFPLRSLNTIETIPVDLNSILYYNEITIAEFHERRHNFTAARKWAAAASGRSKAMTAILWDPEHYSYFDYNVTSGTRNVYTLADNTLSLYDNSSAPPGHQVWLTAAQYYPFWTGAASEEARNNASNVRRAYERISAALEQFEGSISATNLQTGQQWDEPNVWPPLQYIIIQGLLQIPVLNYEVDEVDYEWTQELALRLAQRYVDSTFCTWRSTLSPNTTGIMFEKYNQNSTNAAGGGGEYEVVEGFGWSNGVLIWAADVFADKLQTPDCGNLTAAEIRDLNARSVKDSDRSALHLYKRDAQWVKKFN